MNNTSLLRYHLPLSSLVVAGTLRKRKRKDRLSALTAPVWRVRRIDPPPTTDEKPGTPGLKEEGNEAGDGDESAAEQCSLAA